MRAIRWITSLTLILTAAPALASRASPWGHDDTPYADDVAARAGVASPAPDGLEAFEDAPNAAESGAFIDGLPRGAATVPDFKPSDDRRYATPGTPFTTELGIPLA
jgi:hypothetical protein